MATTVQIDEKTKSLLEKLKIHKRESFNEVIKNLVMAKFDVEPLSDEEIRDVEKSLKEIKAGRYYTHEQVKRNLNLK
jgi:predicted transcriptional regulator